MRRSTLPFEMTNFYYPGSRQRLRLIEKDFDNPSSNEEMSEDEIDNNGDNQTRGFVGWEKNDITYRFMLEHFGIPIEYEEMSKDSREQEISSLSWEVAKNRSPMYKSRIEPIPVHIKADIIINWLYKHKKKDVEAYENGISIEQVENIIYEFISVKRAGKKERKKLNLSRQKLYRWHYRFLEEFADNNFGKGFTLKDAKSALLSEFPDLNDVSISTLSQLFRKHLKFSYKKLGVNNPIKERPENKSSLLFWIKLVSYFIKEKFHVVFLDEFMINRETIKTYGWARKGQPGRIIERPSNFKMSFIVAHTPEWVEGLVGTKSTFDQNKYAYFLRTLIAKLKSDSAIEDNKIVIVADNCRFHRTNQIRRIFEKENLIWLFIPSYSPEANPCEKLINFIKSHIKIQISKQRYSTAIIMQ